MLGRRVQSQMDADGRADRSYLQRETSLEHCILGRVLAQSLCRSRAYAGPSPHRTSHGRSLRSLLRSKVPRSLVAAGHTNRRVPSSDNRAQSDNREVRPNLAMARRNRCCIAPVCRLASEPRDDLYRQRISDRRPCSSKGLERLVTARLDRLLETYSQERESTLSFISSCFTSSDHCGQHTRTRIGWCRQ